MGTSITARFPWSRDHRFQRVISPKGNQLIPACILSMLFLFLLAGLFDSHDQEKWDRVRRAGFLLLGQWYACLGSLFMNRSVRVSPMSGSLSNGIG